MWKEKGFIQPKTEMPTYPNETPTFLAFKKRFAEGMSITKISFVNICKYLYFFLAFFSLEKIGWKIGRDTRTRGRNWEIGMVEKVEGGGRGNFGRVIEC